MSEDEAIVLMWVSFAMALAVVRLLWVNRKLKRQLREQAAPAPAAAIPAPAERPTEVEELRKRVQVLERIATDGNPTLVREIEALRQA